eukprot:7823717-Pyramimonas_sp.AAC.1
MCIRDSCEPVSKNAHARGARCPICHGAMQRLLVSGPGWIIQFLARFCAPPPDRNRPSTVR